LKWATRAVCLLRRRQRLPNPAASLAAARAVDVSPAAARKAAAGLSLADLMTRASCFILLTAAAAPVGRSFSVQAAGGWGSRIQWETDLAASRHQANTGGAV